MMQYAEFLLFGDYDCGIRIGGIILVCSKIVGLELRELNHYGAQIRKTLVALSESKAYSPRDQFNESWREGNTGPSIKDRRVSVTEEVSRHN